MNVWEALQERRLELGINRTPEDTAFAWLFGAVEGFGRELYDGDIRERITSEVTATLLHDALDFYEAQRDE